MAGKTPRPPASETRVLVPLLNHCPECQHPLWVGYHQHRQVATALGRDRTLGACPSLSKPRL